MLLHVNVAIGSGHHHDRLSGRGGLPTYVDVLPTVNQRRRTQIAGLNGLVPGRACLADAMDEVFEAVYEISPQLGGRFHLFLRHQRPAAGTIPPIADADLVAADMEVFRRKKSGKLLQNVAQHFEILFATGAKRFPHLLRPVGNRTGRPAERFRINRRKRLAVSGQVDLRDDLHVAERGVIHDLANVLLRIEPAVAFVPRAVRGRQRLAGPAPGSPGREFRIFLDLDTPAVVVGQVPVQRIELMTRHPVDIPHHGRLVRKVTGHVEHNAPVSETGRILDMKTGDRERFGMSRGVRSVNRYRHQLKQGLQRIERSAPVVRPDRDPARGDIQQVALLGQSALVLFDGYLLDAAAMSAGGKAVAAHPLDVVVQVIEQIRKSGTVNFSLLGDQELPLPPVRPFGSRNQVLAVTKQTQQNE